MRSVCAWAVVLLAMLTAAASAGRPPTTLPIETAVNFKSLPAGGEAVIGVAVDVPEGLHAQSNTPSQPTFIPFKVTIEPNDAIELRDAVYPTGEEKSYPLLGKLNVYEGKVVTFVPIRVKPNAPAGPIKLGGRVQYQVCDDRVCYPPKRPTFEVTADVVPAGTQVEANRPELFTDYKASAAPTTSQSAAPPASASPATVPTNAATTPPANAGNAEWGILTWYGAAILAGLLFNVMPCVLPVLPLKAAAFHRAAEHHRGRSMLLGFAFSLGIIGVFAVLAVLVLVLRVIQWGELFSKWWFVWPLVGLLVVCALGMFGAFSVQLPTALYGVDPRQDTFGGNIIFGGFTAILATPCTAPLLPGLLIWASAQPIYVGVPAMLLVGVGMALPYLILSATPELAKKFPRSGPWPELFKQMMGFMLLAVALYFAGGRLIHGPNFWWLVVAVVAVAALYLMARTIQLTENARPVAVSSVLSVAMLGGAVAWATVMTAPGGGEFTPYSDASFAQLRQSGKPVLVKFTANWCGTCQYIEGTVFRDDNVWSSIRQHEVATLKVDLTTEDAPGQELLLKLNPAGGIPLTAIYPPGADRPIVLESIYNSDALMAALNRASGGGAMALK